jgi:predicted nucleotidyltransferase
MNCDRIIATLRGHEPELRAAGVARLSVFGSMARGESRPDSDIDLLAGFDASRRLSLLDLVSIELRLAGLLGQPADLVEEGTLKLRGATRKECPPR